MSTVHDAAVRVVADPFFLDAPGGRLFAVHHRPADASSVRGHVLVVPPFNEEMNRCRSMVTLQAAAFARLGYGALVIDLHGTGDSAGEHGDARWPLWVDGLRAAHAWLAQRPGGCRAILGTRLGAILAAQFHAQLARSDIALILWQPVVDGKTHLTQFLRVRMAAQLDRADVPKESTASMRKQLDAGESIEVAGYEIHPQLARSIDEAQLADAPLRSGTAILWLENAAGDATELAPPSRKVLDAWAAAGLAVDAATYAGPAFWQVHERVVTPSIVERTTQWFRDKVAAR